jgi:hypothetical protein
LIDWFYQDVRANNSLNLTESAEVSLSFSRNAVSVVVKERAERRRLARVVRAQLFMKQLISKSCLLLILAMTTYSIAQQKTVPHRLASQAQPPCGFDLKCLQSIFMRKFEHSEKKLIQLYGQPDQIDHDSTSGSRDFIITDLTFSNFSVRLYTLKFSSVVRLGEVAVWDPSSMAGYGFTMGMSRDSLEKGIKLKPLIFNQEQNYLELLYFTQVGRYYFSFAMRDNRLEQIKFGEYSDE